MIKWIKSGYFMVLSAHTFKFHEISEYRNIFMLPNQQYSMEFRDLVYIIIALLLAVVLFYIFIWLVPIIIVLIIAYVIYIFLKGPPDNY